MADQPQVVTDLLGTRDDPTPQQAHDLAEWDVDRCAHCGYWVYIEQLDDEGICEVCDR